MVDFEIKPRNRRCSKTDRAFEPGEEFYSVLVVEGAEVVRYDFAAENWEGPPEKSLGWWKSQVPGDKGGKVHWAPNEVMQHYFRELENNPEKEDVRYILSLLMVRRRLLRLDETKSNAAGREVLVVYCAKEDATFEVPVCEIMSSRVEAIQNELADLLFAKTS